MRPVVLVATTSPIVSLSLQALLSKRCRELSLKLEVCPGGEEDKKLGATAYESAEALFEFLEQCSPNVLADTMVVLYIPSWDLANAFCPEARDVDKMTHANGWHSGNRRAGIAVELLLRFPHVFPVFLSEGNALGEGIPLSYFGGMDYFGESGTVAELCRERLVPLHFASLLDNRDNKRNPLGLGDVLTRFSQGMRCWFDPTGLRTLVKNHFLGAVFGERTKSSKLDLTNTEDQRRILLERLEYQVVAVDEELEFAMLNAYTAYRFGMRAWIITSFQEHQEASIWNWGKGTVLRDIDLRFADLPNPDSEDCPEKYKAGNSIRTRFINILDEPWPPKVREEHGWSVRAVSSHPLIETNPSDWSGNELRLGQREKGGDLEYLGLSKPITTLYGLKSLLFQNGNTTPSVAARLKPAEGGGGGRHGAPYLNLAMAESLLLQARHCQSGPRENLIGALLACEAIELLLGMSRTTVLEAMILQHNKEVMAEVEFPGVAMAIDTKERDEDIRSAVDNLLAINCDAEPGKALRVRDLFLSRFWAELKIIYRNGEQFEAAEESNSRSLVYGNWLPKPGDDRRIDAILSYRTRTGLKTAIVGAATSPRKWFRAFLKINAVFIVGNLMISAGAERLKFPISDSVNVAISTFLSSISLQPMGTENDALVKEKSTKPGTSEGTFKIRPGVGLNAQAPQIGVYLELTDQLPSYPNLRAERMYVVALIWTTLHMAFSYLLFGTLISMLYRKVTRG